MASFAQTALKHPRGFIEHKQHLGMFFLLWGPPVFLEGLVLKRKGEGLDGVTECSLGV